MATLGKNQVFEIKNGDGTSFHNLVLRKSAVESIVMSLGDKISGDVYYKDNTLSVTMHEYITYNGVNYMLINPPTIVREGVVSDNSELRGMTKYSFVFYHPMYQLANFPFTDVAVTSDETRYLSEGKTFSWIGRPADFVAKLNKNLTGTEWIVEISPRFPQDKLDELSNVIQFDKATIADACKVFYDTWGVPYVVDKVASTEASYATGKRFKLVMGLPSNEIYENASAEQQNIPFVFQMGHGVGLKNNSRTPRNNKIITRISGYGSENNIPYGYPQVRWYGTAGQSFTYGDHAGVYTNVTIGGVHFDKVVSYPIYKGILNGEYVELIKHPFTRTHLMPSVYRTTLFNKISLYNDLGEVNTDYDPDITLVDYYDAIYSAQYPYPNTINLQAPSYESHEFEDEKPELGEAHIISATPLNNDLTPASSWDDSLDDEGNYKQSYFQMVLPQLSFDLYACASITEEMQINMRSGACLGCTFTVQVDWDDYKRNFYDDEGNFAPNGSQRDLTKYPKSNQGSISLVLQKDNSTFGTLMPNMYQYPKGETSSGAGDGDTFVILGISLPESYIFAAEWRLDADMKSYMLENNVHYFDYPLKFDEDFLFHKEYILSQIRPNTVVRFNYAGQTQALFVKQITVKYGDQPLPQYDITLTDNVEVVLNQIGQVAEDVEKLSTLIAILRQSYGKNVWNELAKKLSKTQDDTAAGYITMLKGLQVGANFVPDILGEGGVLRMRDDGKVELVTDILYARMRAYFDSVVIREYRHESGNRIKSPAQGFNASRVENIKVVEGIETIVDNASEADYFRCYWRVDDGEKKAENQFIIGDLAFCEHSDIVNGSLVTKRYWRVVTGRNAGNTTTADGEAWIDLSNAHDANGNPVMTTIYWEGQGGTTQSLSVKSFESSANSYPEAHDDICMLGCTTDTTRQGAIIEYVSGVDAPTYQIYQGLGSDATNPYSLSGKNQITIGYNSATGKAKMDVFGDAYIGARDRSTFIEYKQGDGTAQNPPQLNIKAVMQTLPNSTYEGKTASQFVQDNQIKYDDAIRDLTSITNDLQSQIDGQVETFFYNGTPSDSVLPESAWKAIDIAAGNNNERLKHLGDLYYDNQTGYAYRYSNSGTEASPVFFWNPISDSAVIKALTEAAAALGLAGTKAKTFTTANNTLPSPPYKTGDLWLNATGTWGSGSSAVTLKGDILKVKSGIDKSSSDTASISDWELASNYMNEQDFLDWKAGQYATDLTNAANNYLNDSVANAIKSALGSALGASTLTDGGLMLTSLIYLRKLNAGGDPTDVNDYTTWAGISGEYNDNAAGGGIASWFGGNPIDKEALTPEQIGTIDPQTGVETGWPTLRWAKGVDRFDGSGYRANGNITWGADGALSIANLTSLTPSGSNTNLLNAMIQFNNAFHFTTHGVSPNTYITINPQASFERLFLYDSQNPNTPIPVASQKWVGDNYISKAWFSNILKVHYTQNSEDKVLSPNEDFPQDATDKTLESVFSFWTNYGLTALGKGIDGTHVVGVLDDLNDVTITNPQTNQVLKYNGTQWVNAAAPSGASALSGLTDVAISSLADKDLLQWDYATGKWKNVVLSTVMSGYATTSQLANYLPLSGGTITGVIYGNTGNGLVIQSNNTGSWKEGLRIYPASNNYCVFSLQSSDSRNVFAMVTNVSSHIAYFDYVKDGVIKTINMPYKDGTIALTSDIPTAVSQLTNDSGFITLSNVKGNLSKWDKTAMNWGTLTPANGYTIGVHAVSPDGGDWGMSYKDGQIFMQLDGYYYQNEGKYRVADTSDLSNYLPLSGGTMANTNIVTNLNADLLDGFDAGRSGNKQISAKSFTTRGGNNNSYYKIGSLPTISGTGSGESFVIIHAYNFINYGGNKPAEFVITASSRGNYNVVGVKLIGTNNIKVGYVINNDRMEIWICSTTTFIGESAFEVVSANNFKFDFLQQSNAPSGFVEGNIETAAYLTSNVASATKLQTARKLWGQNFDGSANVDGTPTINTTTDFGVKVFRNASQRTVYSVGKAESKFNLGYFGFHHLADGSNTNYLTFGLYGADELVNILGNGNVGIGTASPQKKLDVNGDVRANGKLTVSFSADEQILISGSFTGGAGAYSHAVEAINPSLSSGEAYLFDIGRKKSHSNTAYFGYVYGGQNTSYATIGLYGHDRILNVTASENVGIGTTSPSYKLHVNGSFNATSGYINGNAIIHAGNIGSQSVSYASSAGSVAWGNVSGRPTNVSSFTNDSGYITSSGSCAYATNSGTASSCSGNAASATVLATSRSIWGKSFDGSSDISGTIYLNENTPHYFRDPSNASWRGGMFWGSAGSESMSFVVVNSGTRFQFVGGSDIDGWGSGTWRSVTPWLEITSSGIVSSGGVTALSDARHKAVIGDTPITVEQIAQMPAVLFRWTDEHHDHNTICAGTLAQKWEGVLPQVVSIENNSERTRNFAYGVAALISSITIARKVVNHEERITELERECKEWKDAYHSLKMDYEQLKLKIA